MNELFFKKIAIVLLSVLTIELAYNYISDYIRHKGEWQKSSECQAFFTIHTATLNIPIVANIAMDDDSGSITVGGPVYKGSVLLGSISRKIEFDYINKKDISVLEINNTLKFNKDSIDDQTFSNVFFGLSTSAHTTMYVTIKQLNGGLFVSRDNIPLFYCKFS